MGGTAAAPTAKAPAVTGTILPGFVGVPLVQERAPLVALPLLLLPDRGNDAGWIAQQRVEARRALGRQAQQAEWARQVRQVAKPLGVRPGVPSQTVSACRSSIAAEAAQLGAVRVDAVSAGVPTGLRGGAVGAPIMARVVYARGGKMQVREAQITCRLNAQGRVVALL
jgi:hypothetical protein